MKNQLRPLLACAFGLAVTSPTWADNRFKMTFDGISPAGVPSEVVDEQTVGSAVLGFYNNDDRTGSQPWNTTFSPNALSICEADGNGCYGNAPQSPGGGSYVGAIENDFDFILAGPFLSDLSFDYYLAAQDARATVTLFSGTTQVLEPILLSCPAGTGCGWLRFVGLKEPMSGDKGVTRVLFSSTNNSAVFDDMRITTTGSTSIPEPSTYALMATGLALLASVRRRRATH